MGLLDKLFGKVRKNAEKPESQERNAAGEPEDVQPASEEGGQPDTNHIITVMLQTAEMAVNVGNYRRAAEIYRSILKIRPNETAQYNLGSLHAQGKGVNQDFMEGARWFHQAELAGNKQAGNLCLKCSNDFIHQNFDRKSPEQLYTDMVQFVKTVYPEENDVNLSVCRILFGIAGRHFNRQEYAPAAKLFRAAAEFGNDGYSQNYLAVLYNLGAGIKQNDLAALYWFDKAVDNGAADVAQVDRDGILNAYRTNFSAEAFRKEIMMLSGWCSKGSRDVPMDPEKAAYWREIGESDAKDTAEDAVDKPEEDL